MNIDYSNNTTEKLCTNYKKAQKSLNKKVAESLFSAINFLESATNLMDIKNFPTFNFHALKGKRKGTYSIDIAGRRSGYRLILIPLDANKNEWENVEIIEMCLNTQSIIIKEVSKHYE